MLTLEGEDAKRFWEEFNKPPSKELIQMCKDAIEISKRIKWDS